MSPDPNQPVQAEPVLDAAVISHTVSPVRERRRFQGIPGIAASPGGLLWAMWYTGGPEQKGEGAGNFLVFTTSRDQGQTWQENAVVHPVIPNSRVFDSVFWLDPLGRLWCFWAQSRFWYDGWAGVWACIAENPEDPLTRWSTPQRIADGIMMNKPTVTSNGEWLLPVAIWTRTDTVESLHERQGSGVWASVDQGKSWEYRGCAKPENPVYDEHMIVEREPGDLWMLIRTATGIRESTSTDGGRHWSATVQSPIPHVNSRFFIRRLASGRLVLVSNNPGPDAGPKLAQQRTNLTVWLSEDHGQSWKGGLRLDDRDSISYPDGVELADGTLFIIYDHERYDSGEISIARMTEADILAGQLSATTLLRHRIS